MESLSGLESQNDDDDILKPVANLIGHIWVGSEVRVPQGHAHGVNRSFESCDPRPCHAWAMDVVEGGGKWECKGRQVAEAAVEWQSSLSSSSSSPQEVSSGGQRVSPMRMHALEGASGSQT